MGRGKGEGEFARLVLVVVLVTVLDGSITTTRTTRRIHPVTNNKRQTRQLVTPMKILPPADENERQALKLRMERALGQEQGGYWRVDIIAGRYGWYVRPGRLRTRTKGERAPARTPAVAST
jgi:hypothetical protein